MKRAILSVLLLALSVCAHAQFSPNTVLTAAALNNALANPAITGGSINGNTSITTSGTVTLSGTNSLGAATSATTQGYIDNSNLVATTSFAKTAVQTAMATIPMAVSSGTYNFAPIGTGAIFGVTTSGGAITGVTSIVAGGSGYQVGDCLSMVGGNGDAFICVNAVSSGAVTAAYVLYGGTGYTGTPQLSGVQVHIGSRSRNLTGTLTGNVLIILPRGTYLTGARRLGIQNNTTGNFTVTVKLSDGAGGSTGTGTVIPQGTGNSTSMALYSDGVNDIWPESGGLQALYSPTGVAYARPHSVQGTATLAAGTVTVTLTNAAVFTSSTSYVCNASDVTGSAAVQVVQNSGSSITFNGTNTHVIQFRCAGN